jgi:hypothetical protein
MTRIRRLIVVSVGAVLVCGPAQAYNHVAHQNMVDIAWQTMRLVRHEQELRASNALGSPAPAPLADSPPAGVQRSDWLAFLEDIQRAVPLILSLDSGLPPPSPSPFECGVSFCGGTVGDVHFAPQFNYSDDTQTCGTDTAFRPGGLYDLLGDADGRNAGMVLGFQGAHVDDEVDDTHLWYRPASNFGLVSPVGAVLNVVGEIKRAASELELSLRSLLAGLVCLLPRAAGISCADRAPSTVEILDPVQIEGLLPGVFDTSNDKTTTLWHFLNLQACASNSYDDMQGMYYQEGGPGCSPGALDLALMVGYGDGLGASLNYFRSNGPSRYEFVEDKDGHRGKVRSPGEWQDPPLGRLPFSPLDNLAWYGWDNFRRERSAKWLGWPLHALGDATVPHHVASTTGYGHRPYEDAVDSGRSGVWLVSRGLPASQFEQARRVLQGAFVFRKMILDWRTAHPGRPTANDVPVRDLIIAIAAETFKRTLAAPASVFRDGDSVRYELGEQVDKNEILEFYATKFADFELSQVELGMSGALAFLVSASELPALPLPAPAPRPESCNVNCLPENHLCGVSNSLNRFADCCDPLLCLKQADGNLRCVTETPPVCKAERADCSQDDECCSPLRCRPDGDNLQAQCLPSCDSLGNLGRRCQTTADCCPHEICSFDQAEGTKTCQLSDPT